MNNYLFAMRKTFTFSGRANRSEYWWFTLVVFLLAIIAAVVDLSLDPTRTEPGIITALVVLIHLIPALSVTIRRLHDTGRSGWWVLFGFIPLVGLITLLVFALTGSQAGENRFGPLPQPKAGNAPRALATGSPAPSPAARVDQLQKLAALRECGALSTEEYQKLKAEALAGGKP